MNITELKGSQYKSFYDGLSGSNEVEKVRMEVQLPEKLLDKIDQTADESEEYSSRSELVREVLREEVDG